MRPIDVIPRSLAIAAMLLALAACSATAITTAPSRTSSTSQTPEAVGNTSEANSSAQRPEVAAEADAARAAAAAVEAAEQAKAAGNGLVHGSVQLVGGPRGNPPAGVPGTVTVRAQVSGKVVRTVTTDPHGHYTVALPPGRYLLSAVSPEYDAGKGTCVTDATGPISEGDFLERDFVCSMK